MSDRAVFWFAVACWIVGAYFTNARADTWITPGAVSYHLERTQDDGASWNETNYGLGVEHELSDKVAIMVGAYRNSLDAWTRYAMVQYTPLQVGPVRLGAMVGVADGYGQGIQPALAPVATIEGKRFGVNVSFIPEVESLKTAAVFAVQLKWRL